MLSQHTLSDKGNLMFGFLVPLVLRLVPYRKRAASLPWSWLLALLRGEARQVLIKVATTW